MNEALQKLIAQRAAKYDAIQALLDKASGEKRALTADEGSEHDALNDEYDALSADIKRMEKQIERANELSQLQRPPLIGGGEQGGGRDDNTGEKSSDVQVDMSRYSLFNLVRALATGNWENAVYEREKSLEIAEQLGREANGAFIPLTVQRAVMATQSGGSFTDAGALVGTDHMADMFIESLQADSFVVASGAHVLPGLVGNVDIPRSLGGISFTWVDEDGDATDTGSNLDTVAMTPKTITGAVPITRRLIKQSSPAVEALIYSDIRKGVALAIDTAAISADGTANQPTGILHTTGVNTQAVANGDGIPTFAEAVGFETALAEDNALAGSPIYVTPPAISQALKTAPIDSGSGIMLNMGNEVNGYPIKPSTLMPTGKTLFGNFQDVIIGMWGVMDITVDTASKAASGGTVLRVFQDIDVAVRHPQSFCVTA